jgi:hypothetical protein
VAHELTHHPLPGIDPRRLQRLTQAGLASLEDVVETGPDRLAELTGFDPKTCRALVRVARAALDRQNPDVIEFVPAKDEPSSVRLTRGLTAARNIERAVSLVRKARSHAGRKPPRTDWADAHGRARRQVRKLLERLEELQQAVLSEGLSQASHQHLEAELESLAQALQPLLDGPIRKKSLKRLRATARRTRKGLST